MSPSHTHSDNSKPSHTHSSSSHTHPISSHSHSDDTSSSHTHSDDTSPSYTHSSSSHTHSDNSSPSHTHSSLSHTHSSPSHTHSSSSHTHSDSSPTHSSTSHTNPDSSHTHSSQSHTHSKPNNAHSNPSHEHFDSSHTHSSLSHTHSSLSHTHSSLSHSHSSSSHKHTKNSKHNGIYYGGKGKNSKHISTYYGGKGKKSKHNGAYNGGREKNSKNNSNYYAPYKGNQNYSSDKSKSQTSQACIENKGICCQTLENGGVRTEVSFQFQMVMHHKKNEKRVYRRMRNDANKKIPKNSSIERISKIPSKTSNVDRHHPKVKFNSPPARNTTPNLIIESISKNPKLDYYDHHSQKLKISSTDKISKDNSKVKKLKNPLKIPKSSSTEITPNKSKSNDDNNHKISIFTKEKLENALLKFLGETLDCDSASNLPFLGRRNLYTPQRRILESAKHDTNIIGITLSPFVTRKLT